MISVISSLLLKIYMLFKPPRTSKMIIFLMRPTLFMPASLQSNTGEMSISLEGGQFLNPTSSHLSYYMSLGYFGKSWPEYLNILQAMGTMSLDKLPCDVVLQKKIIPTFPGMYIQKEVHSFVTTTQGNIKVNSLLFAYRFLNLQYKSLA